MSHSEHVQATQTRYRRLRVSPKCFFFYDKATGAERFEIKAGPGGSLPVDQAASLMAVHCLVRGAIPKDFGVMVSVEENLLDTLLPIAKRLVQACAESNSAVHLSHRQQEVLQALMQDGSNKEIGAKLNISVRTVKFHVSALLEKFNVHSRMSLVRRAADLLLPEGTAGANDAAPKDPKPVGTGQEVESSTGHAQPLRVVGQHRASR